MLIDHPAVWGYTLTPMLFRGFLWGLLLVNALSIFGYATFSRHSELLIQYPWSQPIFENAYWVFARLQILLAFGAMVSLLHSKVRTKWFPAFISSVVISLSSELSGTTWGLPFGSYEYTDLLGPTILGRVPYLIPVSWFFMGLASFGIAYAIFNSKRFSVLRMLLAAWILVSWDLTLDPAMSHLAPFWNWNEPGPYYGTPLLNLVGWYFTGLIIMLGFEVIRVRLWIEAIPLRELFFFYGANLLLPIGIVVAAGLWEAIGITLVCYGLVGLLFLWRKVFWTPRSIVTHFNVK